MPQDVISPTGSSFGFRLGIWIKKNKDKIKQTISIGAGLATFFIAKNSVLVDLGLGTLVKLGADLALDWLDFRYSDVLLDPNNYAKGELADPPTPKI